MSMIFTLFLAFAALYVAASPEHKLFKAIRAALWAGVKLLWLPDFAKRRFYSE